MFKLTESLKVWMVKNYPEKLPLLMFGHIEIITEEMEQEYIKWCKTEEGKSYLKGGVNYKEPS